MKKITLIKLFWIVLATSSLSANSTMCYKKNWENSNTIEKVKLDGGFCKGELSILDMKKRGWEIKDVKVTKAQKGSNYEYLLTKNVTNKNHFSFRPIKTPLTNVTKDGATINIGNLKIGQSGIIIKKYEDNQKMIVSSAYVSQTNNNTSQIKFIPFTNLKQDALPNTKSKVGKNDTLILNYMYNKSLLISPSRDVFQTIRKNFKYNTFLHSDIFAAKLKASVELLPSKSTIQKFSLEQNLGTIFIVVSNKIYVLDAKTFSILHTYPISYNTDDTMIPFYTRVLNIKENIFYKAWKDINQIKETKSLFSNNKDEKDKLNSKYNTYTNYYKSILGLK